MFGFDAASFNAQFLTGDVRGKPVTYSLEAKPGLLGAFTELRMQDVQVPAKYAADVYIGYDYTTKTVIVHWMDSFGAKFSIPHGTGELKENTLQFTFPYEGGNFRDTFTFDPEAGCWTFVLESQQSDGSWKHFAKYKVIRKTSKRTLLNDVVIPPNLAMDDLATYLNDIFHEFARLGENVEAMPD